MALAIGFVAWDVFLLPSSLDEALFRYRLSRAVQTQKIEINFSELATFEWEEVCDHHPYDGDFKHPKYGRTYTAPMSAAHDGVWVLLFIEKDGSPTYISGSCTRGGASIREFGCLSRTKAVFRLESSGLCPRYSAAPDHK
ncbi:hypothetical protein [Sterolibacterium denitrificans]|nr:hypothetical protein [Sterolibacterium denitrificans]